MMSTFGTHYRLRAGQGAFLGAVAALALSGCGLELTPRSALETNIAVTTNPSPTPTSTPAPDSGPTASVSGTINGQTVMFSYVLLNTDSGGNTALEFLSYDPCLWAQGHSASTFPLDFNTLIVDIISVNAAPAPGVYTDVSGTGSSSSLTVDPNSSYGSIANCIGTWTSLTAGTSVTISAINTTASTASGSISALLQGGGIISGTFSTTACNVASTNFAGDAADACSALQ